MEDDNIAPERREALSELSPCTDAPGAKDRFTDLAARLFSVPKEEYDKEEEAVANGKPLKHDFSKRAKTPTKK